MIMQSGSKGHASSVAYVAVNSLVWVCYVALVLLATQVFRFHTPLGVAAATLVAAVVLEPLRRRAARAARQRLIHR